MNHIFCVYVCVCVRSSACLRACVCVCVVSVIVKRPALPPCGIDGRNRNLFYYYYIHSHLFPPFLDEKDQL